MRVGLTGGIGSGKSVVAEFFSQWGAVVIDADVLAREVVAPGTAGLAQIAQRWPGVITAAGALDRSALSRIVFADPDERRELNAIVHPRVRAAGAAREHAAPLRALIVHVIPLLFEGEDPNRLDASVLVIAPASERIARVSARDGVRASDVLARMAAQIDPLAAAALADYVITNDADLTTLKTRARLVFDSLEERSAE